MSAINTKGLVLGLLLLLLALSSTLLVFRLRACHMHSQAPTGGETEVPATVSP
ncbi:MAG: hypothetical protein ACPGCS_06575 [Opitutales bacterium]